VGHDEIRRLLAEELARQAPPPMGDLVAASVRQGRRMRRTRNLWTAGGAGGLALACLVAGVFLVTGGAPRGTAGTNLGFAAPTYPSASPTGTHTGPEAGHPETTHSVPAAPASPTQVSTADPKVKATTRGMLELLSHLLPEGTRSTPAQASDGSLFVGLNLDRGHGVGMVRLSVVSGHPVDRTHCPSGSTCRTLPDGNFVAMVDLPDNCIERHAAFLSRKDGITVGIQMSSCLSWNGTTNPPSQVVLSDEEAIAVADDPRWGTEMVKSLVDGGQRDFPHLSTFS
jgi:hypothetical protein